MRKVLTLALYLASLVILTPSAGASHRHSSEMPVRGVSFSASSPRGVNFFTGTLPEPVVIDCSPETRERLEHMRRRHSLCYQGEAYADSAFAYSTQAYLLARDSCGIDSPECVGAYIKMIQDMPGDVIHDLGPSLAFEFNPWGENVGYAYYYLGKRFESMGDYEKARNAFGSAKDCNFEDRCRIIARFKYLLFSNRDSQLSLRLEWKEILEELRQQPHNVMEWLWFEINRELASAFYDYGKTDMALKRIEIAYKSRDYSTTLQMSSLLRLKYKILLPTDRYAALDCLELELKNFTDRKRLDYDEKVRLAEALMLRGDFEIDEHMDYNAGLDYYNRALETLKTPYPKLTEPMFQLYCRLMRLTVLLRQSEQIIPQAEVLVKMCKAKMESDKYVKGAVLLADCYLHAGRIDDAKELLEAVGPDVKKSSDFYNDYILLKSKLLLLDKRFDEAAALLEPLCAETGSYDDRLKAVRSLAVVNLGARGAGLERTLDKLIALTKENTLSHITQISPRQRRNWLLMCRRSINNLATFAKYYDISVPRLADLSLYMKGLLFRTSAEVNRILERHPDTRAGLEKLKDDRIRLNYAVSVGDTAVVRKIASEIDMEERRLVGSVAGIKELSAAVDPGMKAVLSAVGGKSLVVDFVKDSGDKTSVYGAVIYSRGNAPVFVDLFEDSGETGAEVGPIIWEKLAPYMTGYTDIYFSADGVLNRIPIEFAEYGGIGPICFQKRMHRVFHLADIARDCTVGDNIMAVGVSDHNSPVAAGTTVYKGNWSDLTGVDAEMESIKRHFGAKCVKMLYNDSATEAGFKSADRKGVNVLHVSTHGVFRSHDELLRACGDSADFDHNMARRAVYGGLDNLSGLVMRGGNMSWKSARIDTAEDDILTAEEIETLSFPDLRLTVLSACDTGLGNIDAEGVWGLQRAFRIAGSRFMICALNKVDQYWSAEFMDIFYDNASKGKTIYESFQAAVGELYRMNPDTPEIWSSYILIE